MESHYTKIKQLIDLWESYEDEAIEEHNLLNFAEWMLDQLKERPVVNAKKRSKHEFLPQSETKTFLNKLELNSRFQEYILRIARFEEFYIRKYLVNLPLNSRLEYLFLYTVDNLERARKTELINIHLVEYTTGMDTIRRLIKNNLLCELPDEQDKRAKLLKLTKEGAEILQIANKRIAEAHKMFLACISPNKWKKVLSVLDEIHQIHSYVYLNHYDKPYAEVSNLMDSLKHISKLDHFR